MRLPTCNWGNADEILCLFEGFDAGGLQASKERRHNVEVVEEKRTGHAVETRASTC